MTGTLQEKNGTYYIVLNTYVNGKRKLKWIPTGLEIKGNKREANEMLKQTLKQYNEAPKPTTTIMFHDYMKIWLTRAKQRVCLTTYEGYEIEVRRNVLPYFTSHPVKLTDVNRRVLQSFFDMLIERGRLDGKGPLSPKTLRHIKNVIHLTLREAVKDELIPSNPCDLVELPRQQKFDANYYNAEEMKTLFNAIKGDVLEPMIKITALYGLRRSEILGIKWDSIDFVSKRLTIKHTVVTVNTTVAKDSTKNSSSRRSYLLTAEAIKIFEEAKAEEEKNRKFFGDAYQENDYVFKWPDGKPFATWFITDHFSRLLKRNGLPHIRFHELRHSCASMLLNDGFTLKDVQEYMGHADIKMTADLYGHLDIARKNALAGHLSERIF